MKKRSTVLVAALMFLGAQARSQTAAPIKLIQTYELPAEVKGNFDHFGIDLKGGRLFATPEGYHAVVVFDLKTGKLVRSEEHTSELQSHSDLVCRLLLEKKK